MVGRYTPIVISTHELIALGQPGGGSWTLSATLWLIPADDETALIGQGYLGEKWREWMLTVLEGAQWGGFASEDLEFPASSTGPSTGSATFSFLDDSSPTYRVEVFPEPTGLTVGGVRKFLAIRGIGEAPTFLRGPPPEASNAADRQPKADLSSASELVSSETSQAIRLRAIAVVEQLTHRIEDAANTEHERAVARAVREYLTVLEAYVNGELPEDLAKGIVENLRHLGGILRDLSGYARLTELGSKLLNLIGEIG